MKHCKKCLSSAIKVHVLSSGLCQECQSEYDWKNGDKVRREQIAKAHRISHYEKAKKYIDRKWKEKYGDDDIDTVLGYK